MSHIDAIDTGSLRARLTHALRLDVSHDGSLYLFALAACYLACSDPGEEEALEMVYYAQAEEEGVDGDEILTWVAMLGEALS